VVKLPPPSNSAIRRDRNTIPVSIRMFSGVNFSMAPSETLLDETRSKKSKMAAEKNEIKRNSVSIPEQRNSNGYTHVFEVGQPD